MSMSFGNSGPFARVVAGICFVLASLVCAGQAKSMPGTAYAIRCDGCSNPVIISMLQEEYPNYNLWYVFDLQSRAMRHFYKASNVPGPGQKIMETPLTPEEAAYWNLVVQFYDNNHGSLEYFDHISVNIQKAAGSMSKGADSLASKALVKQEGGNFVTAWDAVNEGYYRNQLQDYLNSRADATTDGFFTRLTQFVGMDAGAVQALFGVSDAAAVKISIQQLGAYLDVVFQDGSSQRYGWDPTNHSFLYVAHTSKDASGNSIPDGPSDVGGSNGSTKTYVFQATPQGAFDALSWYQRVTMWQVSAPSPRTPAVVACVTAGGATTCTLSN